MTRGAATVSHKTARITSERRIITVLAVDIAGSTRHIADSDPDDAQTLFDRCFELWRVMITRAGGTMVSFEGDGGIAAFGWPDALEDHADRACTAAWDIQHGREAGAGPDGKPVQFRVGVHSGLVALRQVRRGGRSRLDTVGATVHVAAKLQQSAPYGEIVVSGEAARLCRSQLELQAHELPANFGGGAVEAFRLIARPDCAKSGEAAIGSDSPIIGREAELAKLRASLPRAGGRNAAVAIIGEPGIGKSRLAATAIAESAALEAKTLIFFGDAQTRTTPFAAARSLLREAGLGVSGDGQTERARAALGRAGLDEGEWAAIQALLSSRATRTRAKAAGMTDTQLARLFAKAFCAIALDGPTLLLVEDLHLIDSESRQFLRFLAAEQPSQSLCLLLTGRPESMESAEAIASTVLALEPLSRDAMIALGEMLWPEARPTSSELERLVDRADGIPFVLVELIHTVGSRSGSSGQFLPQKVESLIHARLQRLSAEAKALAQALSLLGENVDLSLACEVTGLGSEPLLASLHELERFAFVHPQKGNAIRMRHQIIAEACADTIPRERRRQLHRAAIETITALHASLDGRHEQLAFHAEGAGDNLAALDYLWEAALEARRSSATTSLNLIFDRAIELVGRIGDAAEERYVGFVLKAFAAIIMLGEFDKMNTHLPRVMEVVRRLGRPDLICNTLSQTAMICWFEGRYEEGLRASVEGLALARQLRSPALVFGTQLMLANNLHGMGQVHRAVEECKSLCDMLSGDLETARLGAPGLPKSMALSFASWFMRDVGAYEEGLEYAQRGLDLAARHDDLYGEVLARHSVAHNLLMLHRNDEAVECLATARDIIERNGFDAIKANIAGRIAIALARAGRPGEAIEVVEDCLRRKLHLRTGRLENYCLLAGYAEALFRRGEIDRGLATLDEALAIARRIHNPCLLVDGLGLRARLLADASPQDGRIARDVAERRRLCAEFGLAEWPDVTSGAESLSATRS